MDFIGLDLFLEINFLDSNFDIRFRKFLLFFTLTHFLMYLFMSFQLVILKLAGFKKNILHRY